MWSTAGCVETYRLAGRTPGRRSSGRGSAPARVATESGTKLLGGPLPRSGSCDRRFRRRGRRVARGDRREGHALPPAAPAALSIRPCLLIVLRPCPLSEPLRARAPRARPPSRDATNGRRARRTTRRHRARRGDVAARASRWPRPRTFRWSRPPDPRRWSRAAIAAASSRSTARARIDRALGDPDRVVMLRSAVKPFTLVALVEAGASRRSA